MRIPVAAALLAAMLAGAPRAGTLEVEGVQLEDTAVVDGQKLVLNGAGVRKRGYTPTDVTALYLPQKQATLEAVMRQPGAKRLCLQALRDLSGSVVARYFVGDFKRAATEAEFKSLINEVGMVGGVYGRVHQISKGDLVTIDWVPGKGITTAINGRTIQLDGATYMNSELMFQIILRMYLGAAVSDELRLNMLGVSRSMSAAAARAER